jgi:hypothetical protein
MKDKTKLKCIIKAGRLLALVLLAGLVMIACKKLDFTKTEPIPDDNAVWLHYDDGVNSDGIYANSGGDFDIAIRLNSTDLIAYEGYEISKIKFFPMEGFPAVYYITLWQGIEPPTLLHVQEVSVVAGTWNEFYLDQYFFVNSATDLWAGVWITDYPASTYPAGCDNGPAIAGKGDLFSPDNGSTWYSLYQANPDLNYNWNLQVLVTNEYGKTVSIGATGASDARQLKPGLRDILPVVPISATVSSKLKDSRP